MHVLIYSLITISRYVAITIKVYELIIPSCNLTSSRLVAMIAV